MQETIGDILSYLKIRHYNLMETYPVLWTQKKKKKQGAYHEFARLLSSNALHDIRGSLESY